MCIQLYSLLSSTMHIVTRTILFALLAVEDLLRCVVQTIHGYISLVLQFFYVCPAYCISGCCGWFHGSRTCSGRYNYNTASFCFDLTFLVLIILLIIFYFTYWIEDGLALMGIKVNMNIFNKEQRLNVPQMYAKTADHEYDKALENNDVPLIHYNRFLDKENAEIIDKESVPSLSVDEYPTGEKAMNEERKEVPVLPVYSNYVSRRNARNTKRRIAMKNNTHIENVKNKMNDSNRKQEQSLISPEIIFKKSNDSRVEQKDTLYFVQSYSNEEHVRRITANITKDVSISTINPNKQESLNKVESSISELNKAEDKLQVQSNNKVQSNDTNVFMENIQNITKREQNVESNFTYRIEFDSEDNTRHNTSQNHSDFKNNIIFVNNQNSELIYNVENDSVVQKLDDNVLIPSYIKDNDDDVMSLTELKRDEALLEEKYFRHRLLNRMIQL